MDAVPSRFWIFQAVRERYDLAERLNPDEIESWVVSDFPDEISPGDVVYLWQARTEAALFGWATVTSDVFALEPGASKQKPTASASDPELRVELLYQARFEPPIPRREVREQHELESLEVLRIASGTTFRVEPEQALALNRLARARAAASWPPDPETVAEQTLPRDQPHQPVTWERLSVGSQDVFGWAAAAEDSARVVGTRGLLVGLLRTSHPSEAAQLLSYCGTRAAEVYEALQAVRPEVGINPTIRTQISLRTLPPLTSNGRRTLDVAGTLQEDPAGPIEPRHLFGAILNVDASRASQALERALDGRLDMATVRETYFDYLRDAANTSYSDFLGQRLAGARPSTAITTDAWTDRDQLEHALYADAIAEFIKDEKTKAPLTIGIKAPWGAGKTSLMRMIRKQLDPDAPERPSQPAKAKRLTIREFLRKTRAKTPDEAATQLKPPPRSPTESLPERRFTTIWFNAWKYQSSEQLWAGMAHAILWQVSSRMSPIERDRLWASIHVRRLPLGELRHGFHRYVAVRALPYLIVVPLAALGVTLTWLVEPALLGGASFVGATLAVGSAGVGLVRSAGDEVTKAAPQLVEEPDYTSRLGFLHLVDEDMHRILELASTTSDETFVVFVDDLDRCSYGTVAQVIEALNVFLAGDFENCIFVIAMEPDLVAAQIHVAYDKLFQRLGESGLGDDLGWRFLEKMVQLPLALPEPRRPQVERFLDSILAPRIDVEGVQVDNDAEQIVEARTAIREAETSGSLDGIADAMDEVRENAHAAGRAPANLDAVLQKAARLEFKDRFSDAHARAMLMRHAADLSGNPREIKRFLNVFRFYAYVDFWRRTQGLETPGLEGVAKLARIAIGWPSLLSALARDVPQNGSQAPLLAVLESATDDEAWDERVKLAPERARAQLSRQGELHAVIIRQPYVGEAAAGFL